MQNKLYCIQYLLLYFTNRTVNLFKYSHAHAHLVVCVDCFHTSFTWDQFVLCFRVTRRTSGKLLLLFPTLLTSVRLSKDLIRHLDPFYTEPCHSLYLFPCISNNSRFPETYSNYMKTKQDTQLLPQCRVRRESKCFLALTCASWVGLEKKLKNFGCHPEQQQSQATDNQAFERHFDETLLQNNGLLFDAPFEFHP